MASQCIAGATFLQSNDAASGLAKLTLQSADATKLQEPLWLGLRRTSTKCEHIGCSKANRDFHRFGLGGGGIMPPCCVGWDARMARSFALKSRSEINKGRRWLLIMPTQPCKTGCWMPKGMSNIMDKAIAK